MKCRMRNVQWLADLSDRQSDCMVDEVVTSRRGGVSPLKMSRPDQGAQRRCSGINDFAKKLALPERRFARSGLPVAFFNDLLSVGMFFCDVLILRLVCSLFVIR